jgi:hypothetical protein
LNFLQLQGVLKDQSHVTDALYACIAVMWKFLWDEVVLAWLCLDDGDVDLKKKLVEQAFTITQSKAVSSSRLPSYTTIG